MPDKIKVGLITHEHGAHLGIYLASLAECPEVESVVIADSSGKIVPEARDKLKDRLTKVYDDPARMLADEKPTLAMVSMEAALSPAAIELALEHGSHVFAEKPACAKPGDFERLTRRADGKHLHLMLALANRANPEVIQARHMITGGSIGKLYGLEMHLVADQTRLTKPEYHRSWFADKARAGGGQLVWLGVHWLDLAMYLTGRKIERVAAFTGNVGGQPINVEDSAAVAFSLDNGTFGTLTSGYYLDRGYHSHIKIWGERGWVQIQMMEEMPMHWYLTGHGQPSEIQKYEGAKEPRGYSPFVRSAIRACAGLGEVPITNDESWRALRCVFACYEAAASGKTIAV